VGIWVKLISLLRKSVFLSNFLDAVNAGAVGIMIAISLKLGYGLVFDWRAAILMGISILVAFKFKQISSFWIIIAGSLFGYLLLMIN
jgi:chromate transporter